MHCVHSMDLGFSYSAESYLPVGASAAHDHVKSFQTHTVRLGAGSHDNSSIAHSSLEH